MKIIRTTLRSALACLLGIALAGCAAAPGPTGPASRPQEPAGSAASSAPQASEGKPATTMESGKNNYTARKAEQGKYLPDDYELALSFQTEGYEKRTVAEFNRSLMDWENEDGFHRTEEALERLNQYLPEDDPNGVFIFRTLFTSWRECEKKHYSVCPQDQAPWYSGWANLETHGDVYGDDVLLTGAYADFSFTYSVEDETKLTIGERDSLLKQMETGVQAFMSAQSQKDLGQEGAMRKTLKAELERLLKGMSGGLVWGGDSDLEYWWSESWEYTDDEDIAKAVTDVKSAEFSGAYTKAQYDLVIGKLKFDGYETMPIAEFDRKINAVFNNVDEDDQAEYERLHMAYELLLSGLPETDPNYGFLWNTVRHSQEEYTARARSVFSGRTVDPELFEQVSAEVKGDVFGDEITVGTAEAGYNFTYRILDADKLTVKDRDLFLSSVRTAVQDLVNGAQKDSPNMDQAALQKKIEAAGKAASTNLIQFTGCSVDYFEVYR